MESALCAHEEQNQNAGAGVGTDDTTDVAGEDVLDFRMFGAQQAFQCCCIFGAVTVGDERPASDGSGR